MTLGADELRQLVGSLRYKPGWSFKIGGPLNGSLCIVAVTPDSWHPERRRGTQHMFPLPDVDRAGFLRWVFDRVLDCEFHEAAEFFQAGAHRPFYPNHDEGSDYYELVTREAP